MYKTHAEFFIQILVKSDPLFIGQSEPRSFFKSIPKPLEIHLVSDLAQGTCSSLRRLLQQLWIAC